MAFNGTMIPGVAPPSGFLFRPAHPAGLLLGGFIGVSLHGRDSVGPVCASTEAKCAQGDWCCDIGDTCSVLEGAFLCCPSGATGPGCARVCAAGDFQCGSICCAERQTCGGGDTPSPFCINPTGSLTSSTAAITSLSSATSTTPTPTAAATTTPPSLSSTPRPASPSTTSPLETAPTATPAPPRAPASDTGISLSAQITMGVLVPVLVILLVVGLWFCLFRRPARRRREIDDHDMDGGGGRGRGAPGRRRPSTPPPAYTKTEVVVATTSQGYTFSRARSPGAGHEMETLQRPGAGGRPGLAVSTDGRTRTSLGSGSPTETYREGVSRLDV
ncbi:hypothetical protein B0T18DRAFT_430184 [Schizothecium vesticola]|uniref:Uncharacterized protein n=1 Tax=Schizothecium vesticola TaxID=314040 RepID=A0AA40ENV7_9PEZI|nr:hypothetical protein B0T18DRAFT_430184 [Schizothecium vesticola]